MNHLLISFFLFLNISSLFGQIPFHIDTLQNGILEGKDTVNSITETRQEDYLPSLYNFSRKKPQVLKFISDTRYSYGRPIGFADGRFMQIAGIQSLASLQIAFLRKRFGLLFTPSLYYFNASKRTYLPALNNISNFRGCLLLSEGTTGFIDFGRIQLGISNSRFSWGPSEIEHLLVSNNAPGFEHIYFRSRRPIKVPFGTFRFSMVSGRLYAGKVGMPFENNSLFPLQQGSGVLKYSVRYFNGLLFEFVPKVLPNSRFGIIRQFQIPTVMLPQEKNLVIRYLPIFQGALKSNIGGTMEDSVARDQQLSFFYSLLMPSIKSKISIEYGWNDHKWNLRDLLISWPHSAAYILSFKRLGKFKSYNSGLIIEYVRMKQHLEQSLRDAGDWYSFHGGSVGPTHLGQILGVGGSNGLGANRLFVDYRINSDFKSYSVRLARVVNDHSYMSGRPRIWRDYLFSVSHTKKINEIYFRSEISYLYSSALWFTNKSKSSFQLNFSIIRSGFN